MILQLVLELPYTFHQQFRLQTMIWYVALAISFGLSIDHFQSVTQKTEFSGANDLEFMTETHVWRMYQSSKNKSPLNQQHKVEDLQVISEEGRKPDETETNSSSPNLFHCKLLSLDKAWPALTLSTTFRKKLKEPIHNRRRKISVPEIGPMTTVQELAMDSREYSQ